jgi:hypothetical protein
MANVVRFCYLGGCEAAGLRGVAWDGGSGDFEDFDDEDKGWAGEDEDDDD